MNTIYLDNAATSFPKPIGVSDAMKSYMDQIGAKSYFDVDKILQHYERYNLYLEMGGIDTEERFKSYFEALITELGEDVVNKVVNRRKNNFKLKLPLEFIPAHIECL